jgi:anti-sigma factor RsiW
MSGLECQRARVAMDAARDGELPAADQLPLEEHLKGCDDCGAFLADRQALGGLLRLRAEAIGDELPSDFSARVMAALPAAVIRPARRLAFKLILGFLAAGAVAAAVLLPLVGRPVRPARGSAAENEAHVHRVSVTGSGVQPLVFQNDLGQTVVWVVPDSDEKPAPGQ